MSSVDGVGTASWAAGTNGQGPVLTGPGASIADSGWLGPLPLAPKVILKMSELKGSRPFLHSLVT